MYEYAAKLISILDGDTIRVSIDLGFRMHFNTTVRLSGYDAPELKTEAGFRAKEYLYDLLKDTSVGLVIKTTINKEFEKYGRVLGSVTHGTVNINEAMVKAGHVKAATDRKDGA